MTAMNSSLKKCKSPHAYTILDVISGALTDFLNEVTAPRSRIADLVHPLHFADEDTEVGRDWRAADKGKEASLLNPPDLRYKRTRKEDQFGRRNSLWFTQADGL